MYCKKCGTKLSDDAIFCGKCGIKQDGEEINISNGSNDSNTKNIKESNQTQTKNSINSKYIIQAIIVIGIVGAIIYAVKSIRPSIDLNKYISVEFAGYNTVGKAIPDFDEDKFYSENKDKVTDVYTDVDEYEKYFVNPCRMFSDDIWYSLDNSEMLTNGDEVVLTWKVDEEYIKNKYGVKIKYEDVAYTVAGLPEIEKFDAMRGVGVEFEGVSPYGKARIVCAPEHNGLTYEIDVDKNLSNGDVVKVTASSSLEPFEYVEKYGKLPEECEKEFICEGLDEFVQSYSSLSEELLSNLNGDAEDTVRAYIASTYKKSAVNDLAYAGYIYMNSKDSGPLDNKNSLYMVYKGKVTNPELRSLPFTMYYPVLFEDIVKNGEKTGYEKKDSIIGYTTIYSKESYDMDTCGYINPFKCYSDIAEKYRGKYEIEAGDGFEMYSDYKMISQLSDIGDNDKEFIRNDAYEQIIGYVADKEQPISNINFEGEYLLVLKGQSKDEAKNNTYIVVYSGTLDRTPEYPEDVTGTVYFPVVYTGLVNVPNSDFIVTECREIAGDYEPAKHKILWHLKGYPTEEKMFNDLVTANRGDYTFEISGNLKEY